MAPTTKSETAVAAIETKNCEDVCRPNRYGISGRKPARIKAAVVISPCLSG